MDKTATTMSQQIDKLVAATEFARLQASFSHFCPFEATGMVRAEIRHSDFLAYIIKPSRPHGFGTALLKALLESALPPEARRDVSDVAITSVEVRREWQNIDLLIILPVAKTIVAIELKIDAPQSAHQLQKYRTSVQARWPLSEGWLHQFVFLTKHAEAPNDAAWHTCRLANVVTRFEESISNAEFSAAPGLETLKAYVAMMKKHHLGATALEDQARKLWSDHEDALNFLMDRRPDPFSEIFAQVRDAGTNFLSNISPPGTEIIEDKHTKRILRYAYKSWDSLPDFMTADGWTGTRRLVLIEIKMLDRSLEVFVMRGPRNLRDQTFAALNKISGSGRFAIMRQQVLFTSEEEISYELLTQRLSSFLLHSYNNLNPKLQAVFGSPVASRSPHHPRA